MSTTTTPLEEIASIIEKTKPRPPGKCHTLDSRGWALCGAFGPDSGRDPGTRHSIRECRARGHKRCVVCTELARQLSGERMVA